MRLVAFDIYTTFNGVVNIRADVAEWLRRLTANQLGSARTCSNHVVRVKFFVSGFFWIVSGRKCLPDHFGENRIPKFQAVLEIWPI